MGNTGRALHIDRALSEMAIGYRPGGFIADMIFPTVTVANQSNIYYTFDRADMLREEDAIRAPGTPANRIIQNVSSDTYFAKNFALASPVTIEDKSNADPLMVSQLINGRAQFILNKLSLGWELRVATKVTNTSNVGSSSAVTSAWNGAGHPLDDLNTAIDNLCDANGISDKENVKVTMGVDAWRSFRRDSNVRNIIFGSNNGGGYPSLGQAKELLEVGDILVGGAYQNTGEEGLAESLSKVWGDHVLVSYSPPNPTIELPSYGYNFRWAPPGLPNMQVERHPYSSRTKSEDVEVGYYQDEKITGQTYSFLLTAVNSST